MSETVFQQVVTVSLPEGLHLRPANAFVTLAQQFTADVQVIKDDNHTDGKSIMSLITLDAAQGSRLTIRGSGPDAERAVRALSELVERDFNLNDGSDPSEDIMSSGENA